MSAKLDSTKTHLFLITYDYGTEDRPQSRKVIHKYFIKYPILFAENIISFKCLDCNATSYDKCTEKENENGT